MCPVSELSIPVPWGEIRGKVWGPDHGRPVLCLHGWADNCGTFNTLIPLLPKECRYVAVDLAGHGLSSHRPAGVPYTFPANVADVRRVIDGLHWTRFSIIGHSMGDALYPEMVDAVVLLDCFGFVPTDSIFIFKVIRQGMDDVLQFEKKTEEKKRVYTYKKAVERLLAANPTLSERSVHILLERGLVQVDEGFVFSRDLRVNFKNIAPISLEQNTDLYTEMDVLMFAFIQMFIIICFSQHTVVTVSGDHHIHLNDPKVVAPFVCDFLQPKVLSQQLPP
uniref:Serine hydrolase like n=1 Tax=Sander lucioperca TaxID=283035 RepID=A0A8C9Z716_SANLU